MKLTFTTRIGLCFACGAFVDWPETLRIRDVFCDPCEDMITEIQDLHRFQPTYHVSNADILARRLDAAVDDLIALRKRMEEL